MPAAARFPSPDRRRGRTSGSADRRSGRGTTRYGVAQLAALRRLSPSVATRLLLLTLGLGWRAIRGGRRLVLAGATLGLTMLAQSAAPRVRALPHDLASELARAGRWTPRQNCDAPPGFLGLLVTPGQHEIVCQYEPGNGKLYMAIGGFAVVLLLGLAE